MALPASARTRSLSRHPSHTIPPIAAGLREGQRNRVSFSEPARAEQQSPNQPWRGTAAEARTGQRAGTDCCVSPGASRWEDGPTGAGAGCPATKGPPAPGTPRLAPRCPARPSTELLDTAGEPQALRTARSLLQPEWLPPSPRLWLAAGGPARAAFCRSTFPSAPLHSSRTLCQEDVPGPFPAHRYPTPAAEAFEHSGDAGYAPPAMPDTMEATPEAGAPRRPSMVRFDWLFKRCFSSTFSDSSWSISA